MLIYLGCFAVSVLLVSFSNKLKTKNQKRLIAYIGILLPCILAGLRDESIGTDVLVYVKPIFTAAESTHSISDFFNYNWFLSWRYKYVYEHEIGFTIFVYIITKITGSFTAVLFSIQLFINVFIYKGIKRIVSNKYVWLGILTFYLMFYNNTLNMMRQWMAMSLLVFGFGYLLKNENSKYFITVICACLFHLSAVFGLFVFTILKYVKNRHSYSNINNVKQIIHFFIVILGSILFVFLASNIGNLLYAVGLGRFGIYLSGDFSLLPNQFLIRLPMFLILIWTWKEFKEKVINCYFYLTVMWIDLVLSQLISINPFAIRISYYFSYLFVFIIPEITGSLKSKGKKLCVICLTIGYLAIYWWFFYVYKGSNETIPYMFNF